MSFGIAALVVLLVGFGLGRLSTRRTIARLKTARELDAIERWSQEIRSHRATKQPSETERPPLPLARRSPWLDYQANRPAPSQPAVVPAAPAQWGPPPPEFDDASTSAAAGSMVRLRAAFKFARELIVRLRATFAHWGLTGAHWVLTGVALALAYWDEYWDGWKDTTVPWWQRPEFAAEPRQSVPPTVPLADVTPAVEADLIPVVIMDGTDPARPYIGRHSFEAAIRRPFVGVAGTMAVHAGLSEPTGPWPVITDPKASPTTAEWAAVIEQWRNDPTVPFFQPIPEVPVAAALGPRRS